MEASQCPNCKQLSAKIAELEAKNQELQDKYAEQYKINTKFWHLTHNLLDLHHSLSRIDTSAIRGFANFTDKAKKWSGEIYECNRADRADDGMDFNEIVAKIAQNSEVDISGMVWQAID